MDAGDFLSVRSRRAPPRERRTGPRRRGRASVIGPSNKAKAFAAALSVARCALLLAAVRSASFRSHISTERLGHREPPRRHSILMRGHQVRAFRPSCLRLGLSRFAGRPFAHEGFDARSFTDSVRVASPPSPDGANRFEDDHQVLGAGPLELRSRPAPSEAPLPNVLQKRRRDFVDRILPPFHWKVLNDSLSGARSVPLYVRLADGVRRGD